MKRPAKTAAKTMPFATQPGSAHPLGATVAKDGVNFSVFSQYATGVELLLFDGPEATAPSQVIDRSRPARTGDRPAFVPDREAHCILSRDVRRHCRRPHPASSPGSGAAFGLTNRRHSIHEQSFGHPREGEDLFEFQ